jgi:uncharacterized protein
MSRPLPVKVVVAGGFGVGKTTFVGALSDITPLTTEAAMTTAAAGIDNRGDVGSKTTTTVAMDFGRVAIDETLVMYLFGTPGQDRFGFMWDDLVDGALGAVVLVDSRRLDDSFPALDYFEARKIPYIVAINMFDAQLHHSLADLRKALNIDAGTALITTDARSRTRVKEAVITLLEDVLAHAS